MSAERICAQHLARRVVLYVRQSSVHKVQHKYAMRERLTQLRRSEVEIIDDDLCCSAAGGVIPA